MTGNSELKRQQLAALEESELASSRDMVLECLGDSDWRVRKEAVVKAALLAESDSATQEALVAGLCDSQNVGMRNACLEVFSILGPMGSGPLLHAFDRLSPSCRRFAVEALGLGGSEASVSVLLGALESDDLNLVLAALEALSRVGGRAAETALRTRLSVPDPIQQVTALQGLDRLAVALSWRELAPVVSVPLLRRTAISALGRSDELDAIEPLLEVLIGDSESASEASACALAVFLRRHPAERQEIAERLAHVPDVRWRLVSQSREKADVVGRSATELLLLLQAEECLRRVVLLAAAGELTESAVADLRAWGAAAFGGLLRLSDASVGVELADVLEVASDLGRAICEEGETLPADDRVKFRSLLESAASSSDPALRRVAAAAARHWAVAEDAEWLVGLTAVVDPEVASIATKSVEALAKRDPSGLRAEFERLNVGQGTAGRLLRSYALMDGEDAFDRLRTSLTSNVAETRRSAVSALGELRASRAADHVALALGDEDHEVQLEAVRTLGRFKGHETNLPVRQLSDSAGSQRPSVRLEAARALGALGDDSGIAPLLELAVDGDAGVAVAALRALRQFPDYGAMQVFFQQLDHADSEVVKECLLGLEAAQGDSAFDAVRGALAHSHWDVRRQAVRVLAGMGEKARVLLAQRREVEADPLVLAAIDDIVGSQPPEG